MLRTWVQLLGAACARAAVGTVAFAGDKRYQLLAYLARRGEWVPREELAHLFWPDVDDTVARHSLRQLLKRTRRLDWLADLTIEPQRVHWDVETDVAAFAVALRERDWQRAVGLYAGEFLSGVRPSGSIEFEHWLDQERRQLFRDWRHAAFERSEELSSRGEYLEASDLMRRLLQLDDLDEEALQVFMRARANAGQPREALAAFESFSKNLDSEMGIPPSAESRELVRDIAGMSSLGRTQAGQEPAGTAILARERPIAADTPTAPLTSFIGREPELAGIARSLSRRDCRLLTLLGPGGVGKSRIARAASVALGPQYRDGSHFVQLDAVTDVQSIVLEVARHLQVPFRGKDAPVDQLTADLSSRQTLLVLDNFEHLLDGIELLPAIIRSCPEVDLLVTSRVRLSLEEEWLFPVEGLKYPDEPTVGAEEAQRYDAVQLFIQRAQRVAPGFTLKEADVPALLRICCALDGLPLGIELAAPWVRFMPIAEIAQAVERDLDVLRSTARNTAARHASLRTVFEHSWALLSDRERELLRRLSVFRGGFEAEAAETVTGAAKAALAALVDKSLLRTLPKGRYDRHPLIYGFTCEKQREHPEDERLIRERHARSYLKLVERMSKGLRGPEQRVLLDRLAEEQGNVRAALAWAHSQRNARLALRLTVAMCRFWDIRGHYDEGRRWSSSVLAWAQAPNLEELRATLLQQSAVLATMQGDYDEARDMLESGLAVFRRRHDGRAIATCLHALGSIFFYKRDQEAARASYLEALSRYEAEGLKEGIAAALNNLGNVAWAQGDLGTARAYYERSLDAFRELGNRLGIANSSGNIGHLALLQGDLDKAWRLFEEGLAVRRELDDKKGIAITLGNLGMVARARGELDRARALTVEGLQLKKTLGNKAGLVDSLDQLASVAAHAGRNELAAALWAFTDAEREKVGTPRHGSEQSEYEKEREAVRASLDGSAFDAASARGALLTLEGAIALALRED